MNSVVSFMYEGRFLTYGCNHLSTNWDIFSVMLSQLETMAGFPFGFCGFSLRSKVSRFCVLVASVGIQPVSKFFLALAYGLQYC